MGKKKAPQPAPAPQKPATPPTKQASPPTPAPAPKAGEEKKAPAASTPVPGEQGTDLSQVPVQSAEKPPAEKPSEEPAPPTAIPPSKKSAATVPAQPIDWFAMRQPFTNRGVMLTGRDADQIQWNFTTTYNQYMNLGLGHELSLKITNFQLPIYYDLALKRDYPTLAEEFEADAEKAMGPGKKLGTVIVPVVTPDTLGWAVEKISGKKIDFRF